MKSLLVALALPLSTIALAANASTDFAGPYCDTGCRLIDNIKSGGDQIYLGEVSKSYRVCHADGYSVHVSVDGTVIDVPDGNNHNRDCLDVNGKSISVSGSGAAWVGPVSE